MEYEVVGRCPRTGKPVMAPRAWTGKSRGQWIPRPQYGTCSCYPVCQKPKKKQ